MTECAVCGGATQPAERIEARYGGERYECCSAECKVVFESKPETYAAPSR
ncbi:YHS domain-containing protein [Halomicrobium salinisoli]|nr:YHS domain-containing protein [Halomicrobium salinisoli]